MVFKGHTGKENFIMATLDPSGDGPPNHEIPSATTAAATMESPVTMQCSPIAVRGFENAQDTEIKDANSGNLMLAPPAIENNEIELPSLKKDGENSQQPRVFSGEIPDSDAMSDESSIHDGGEHECREMRGESLKSNVVDQAAAQPHPPRKIITEVPDSEGDDEQMEDALASSQFPGFGGADGILPEAAPVPLPGKLATTTADAKLVDSAALSIENNSFTIKLDSMLDTKVITPTLTQQNDTEQNISVDTLSPSSSGPTEDPRTASVAALEVITKESSAINDSCQNLTGIESMENTQTEVDKPDTDTGAPEACTSPINKRKTNIEPEIPVSLATPSAKILSPLPAKLDEATQISTGKQGNGFVSTEIPPLTKAEEGKSSQSYDVETRTTPLKGPSNSQNKDVMITELKAMKIVGQTLPITFTKSFFNI